MLAKKILFFFSYVVMVIASVTVSAEKSIPESLMPWVPWVMEGSEALSCPFINKTSYQDPKNHICAWSGILQLHAFDTSANFNQNWTVLTPSVLPLPGGDYVWPQQVKVNGQPIAVINQNGRPFIELLKGEYKITGEFYWQKIPESITIPQLYAFVEMTINNVLISFPKIDGRDLWLRELEVDKTEQDAILMSVARKLTDGDYIELETYIDLEVSGKRREVKLGQVLPEGFELIGIEADLPSFIDAKGILQTKLKPGNWQIKVNSYAKPTLVNWQRPALSYQWPKDEIWVFEAKENMRNGKFTGAKIIDSGQAIMPDNWYKYPSYLVTATDQLNFDVQHRGKPLHLVNRLALNRTAWLSFDGSTYTFNDIVSGNMISDWRLSMTSPFKLGSAEDKDGAILITSKNSGEQGIENRYPRVDIKARGTVSSLLELPVTGWLNDFETVSINLNLPPATQLFAVFGADSVSNSWLGNWSIWGCFIVLFSALIATRLINITTGLITAFMLILVYQEAGAPIISIINLLLAMSIYKHQPFERIKPLVKMYWTLSMLVALGALLYFSAMQLRTIIHPQLEAHNNQVSRVDGNYGVQQVINAPAKMVKQKSMMSVSDSEVERIQVTGSRIKSADLMMERYQSDSLIQAGAGIPDWQWHSHTLRWSSPVAQGQQVKVLILSKMVYRMIKTFGIILIFIWLYCVLKTQIKSTFSRINLKATTALFGIMLMSGAYAPNTEAGDFPNKDILNELKVRATKAPLCAPQCATINNLVLEVSGQDLTLKLNIHANSHTALALPRSEFWRPQSLILNDKSLTKLIKRAGWIYVPVSKGINQLSISGKIALVELFQLEFKEKPKYIEQPGSEFWDVIGIQENRLSGSGLEFLATRKNKSADNLSLSRFSQKPLVRVIRKISFDHMWSVYTKVERIAPTNGAINLKVPIISGENISSQGIVLTKNMVDVSISAGETSVSWRSGLDRTPELKLTASKNDQIIEQWEVISNPSWHLELSDLPMILTPQDNDDYYVYTFHPYEEETLSIKPSRPKAVDGEVLAIDKVTYSRVQGERISKLSLSFDYRSTRGGEHVISLPEGYQLKQISTDGRIVNLQPEQGQLALPISPGKHKVNITMRANINEQMIISSPQLNLNAPLSNISSEIHLSDKRWILWTKGPLLGPAVLYWGEFIVFLLLALCLSRVSFSPLNTPQWIILGFGLSLNNWGVLMIIIAWFSALTAASYRNKELGRLTFNASQILLYLLSIVAVISLITIIPISLLSSPDMGITGNYSYGNQLNWFLDKSDGILPEVTVFSIPKLVYKAVMLVWVIWLSFAILNWVKWSWKMLGSQGHWRSKLGKQLTQDK